MWLFNPDMEYTVYSKKSIWMCPSEMPVEDLPLLDATGQDGESAKWHVFFLKINISSDIGDIPISRCFSFFSNMVIPSEHIWKLSSTGTLVIHCQKWNDPKLSRWRRGTSLHCGEWNRFNMWLQQSQNMWGYINNTPLWVIVGITNHPEFGSLLGLARSVIQYHSLLVHSRNGLRARYRYSQWEGPVASRSRASSRNFGYSWSWHWIDSLRG